MPGLSRRLAVARGDEPADLVVRGGRVLSVFTREWLDADVAVVDGVIAGIGSYDGWETIDAEGRYVVPGFIDSHMHLESVKLLVDEFARLVLPLGTTAVVADPHEIANVLGADGVHWLLDASSGLQLEVFFTASSCVPASRFESPRRPLGLGDLEALMRRRRVIGLAEMMNFPGVIAGDPAELDKLALDGAAHVDGHAPGVLGKELQAYAAAGIRSDHEMLTVEEGRERLRAGMWLLVREASMARNLAALLPLVEEYGPGRIAFCTDDRDPEDVVDRGHVNGMVRDAVAAGIEPADAILMASFHPALWHRLDRHGAVAPGYVADLLLLPDLERFVPDTVLKRGRPLEDVPRRDVPDWVRQTVRVKPVTAADFAIPWEGGGAARSIGLVTDQVVTESLEREPLVVDGHAVSDPERDLVKIAVLERHLATGRIGFGLLSGSGLRRGALASTVAHDAHNLLVVGASDEDMAFAVRRLAEVGGGIVAVDDGRIVAECPLPVAGLLSDQPLDVVVEQSRACNDAAHALGWRGATPFLTLAFMALSVIPSLKLTDRGLVDVDRFEIVPLRVEAPVGAPTRSMEALLEVLLLRDRAGEQVARHEHVRVRVPVVGRGLRVVASRVRVELALQLEHVAEEVVANGELRQAGRAGEEVTELHGVGLQVGHGLALPGRVLLREGDRIVDKEPHVGAPHERAVEERLSRLRPVDGADRLRELDGVPIEGLRRGRERLRSLDAEVGRVHRQHGVLAEQLVQRVAQIGRGERRRAARAHRVLRVGHPATARPARPGGRGEHADRQRGCGGGGEGCQHGASHGVSFRRLRRLFVARRAVGSDMRR